MLSPILWLFGLEVCVFNLLYFQEILIQSRLNSTEMSMIDIEKPWYMYITIIDVIY